MLKIICSCTFLFCTTVIFSWNAEKGRSYGTWLQNGKQLKLSFEGGSTLYEDFLVYTIETLSAKEMVLREDMENGYVDYYFTKH